jgi:hypothetical protein
MNITEQQNIVDIDQVITAIIKSKKITNKPRRPGLSNVIPYFPFYPTTEPLNESNLENRLKSSRVIKFDWSPQTINKINDKNPFKYRNIAVSEKLDGDYFVHAFFLIIIKRFAKDIGAKEDKYYLKFSIDVNYRYIMPLKTKADLDKTCTLYFNKMTKIKNVVMPKINLTKEPDPNTPHDQLLKLMEMTDEPNKSYKWTNNYHMFAEFDIDLIKVENKLTSNEFINAIPIKLATAYWTKEISPQFSNFRTIYSGSQFIFTMFDSIKCDINGEIYHPVFLTINYPKLNDSADTNDSYKYPRDLPIDCIATLNKFGSSLHNKSEIVNHAKNKANDKYHDMLLHLFDVLENHDYTKPLPKE